MASDKPNAGEKLYYTMGEATKMIGVADSNIRFWEKEFDSFIKLRKTRKGNRIFMRKDIELFQQIHELLKVKGHTLEGAKKILSNKLKPSSEAVEATKAELSALKSIREKLMKLKNRL